ncbi:MAG: chemotaxis protein CheW [Sphingobium sp.]
MDELLQEFLSETRETLAALAGEVVAWEADPGDTVRLDAIFRFFHTVKGSCGFLDLPRFERLSHAAEDVLSDIRAGARRADPATVNAVLGIMDRIGVLTEAVATGAPPPGHDDDMLIDALREQRLADGDGAAPTHADPSIAAAAAGDSTRTAGPLSAPRTIRLPLSLIDRLMNGISDMVLARNEMARKLRDRTADPELDTVFERLSACVADMRDSISRTRMQRVDRLFAALPRMVRDLGRDLGKRIALTLEGGDVEMDREMIEMVVDPLTHIVRNSVDHGIEPPEERRAAGKPEAGSLHVAARQSGNQIVIEVADDGRGIDVDALVAKAVACGALSAQAAAGLSEEERLDLIFRPGLSTAPTITAISGRGVGMDVVRANVERIGGVIALENRPGRGVRIVLRVPLTLTIIPGLILRAGGQYFAIPRAAVIEMMHETSDMLKVTTVGGAKVATIRSVRHSLVDLEDVLGMEKIPQAEPRAIMVVRASSGVPFALGVSDVENHEELVIRPASPLIMATGVYAGMTLPDNGRPMLLLDAGGLASAARLSDGGGHGDMDQADGHAGTGDEAEPADMVAALRFQDWGGRRRLIRLSLVERVEDIDAVLFGRSGDRAYVQMEGRLVPVVTDRDGFVGHQVATLRLRDGVRELCYPVEAVTDIVDMSAIPDMTLSHGMVSGVSVVDGEHLEVVDPFALFAAIAPETPAEPMTGRCLLADSDDGWTCEILAPLLRQSGYAVVLGLPGDAMVDPADVVLCDSRSDAVRVAEKLGFRIIRLRAALHPSDPGDASIYRYDRDALINALSGGAAA